MRDPALEARGSVSRNAETTLAAFADEGLGFERLSRIVVGRIQGGARSWPQEFEAGTQIVVVGGCDLDCRDLRLELIDPEGGVLQDEGLPGAQPRLVAVIERSGAFRIRASTRSCANEPCTAGYQVLVLPPESPRLSEYVLDVRTRLEEFVAGTTEGFFDRGLTAEPLTDVEIASLRGGETASFEVELPAGSVALVAATCDPDCADVDLTLGGGERRLIAADQKTANLPYLVVQAVAGGTYTANVSMIECAADPCYAGMQVVQLLPGGGAAAFGTCFAVSPDGLLLTAHHVVADAALIEVVFADGRRVPATVEAAVAGVDVALLATETPTPHWLPLAPPRAASPGDAVFTVGYPAPELLGSGARVASGEVAALSAGAGRADLMQISVPVQPGNSGGPLVNARGDVVGLVTGTLDVAWFYEAYEVVPQSVNWAVHIDFARPLFEAPLHAEMDLSREEAIERTRQSICQVLVEGEG